MKLPIKLPFFRINVLDFFFSYLAPDIGIDLGTANILVWVKGKGVIIREPSVVAKHKKTKQIIAIGTEAKHMIGKTPASILTIRPLRGGIISDFDATQAMIAHYLAQATQRTTWVPSLLIRPKVAIGIPSSVTEVQRRAVWEAALSAGARDVYLIEEPMAAALGADVSIFNPTGSMIVDIGGGTTEIGVISLGGLVVSRSLKVAGDTFDEAIITYVRLRHGLLIGEKTAEMAKITLGNMYPQIKLKKSDVEPIQAKEKMPKTMIIRGRDIESGLPKSLKITETQIREALSPAVGEIIEAIIEVLEEAPPELTSDILEQGILVTGGGSLLAGIDAVITERTRIHVMLAPDPMTTVVRGTAKVLGDAKLLERVKVTGGLR